MGTPTVVPVDVNANPDGVNATIYLNMDTSVIQPNNATTHVFTLNTTVGPVNVDGLTSIINTFVNIFLLPGLNKHIAKGFPLPTVDGISFVNPEIKFAMDYVYVGTDIKYTPTAKREMRLHQF